MKSLLSKMSAVGNSPPRAPLKHIFWSWLGSSIAIGATALASIYSEMPFLFAPLGASAVLAFAVPDSPLAQPRNIIGGHLISAIVGVLFLLLLGSSWWVMALAVATAIAAMLLTRTVHPPAGANPLLVLMTGAQWDFVFLSVLPGVLILTISAIIFNKLASGRRYPIYWW
ncbi:MAG: HPP family protein [Emcibacteraceae bacterium]|nr:HPP family protein [Emcibacteraceae bacterium]